jgi:hypothetical protein
MDGRGDGLLGKRVVHVKGVANGGASVTVDELHVRSNREDGGGGGAPRAGWGAVSDIGQARWA